VPPLRAPHHRALARRRALQLSRSTVAEHGGAAYRQLPAEQTQGRRVLPGLARRAAVRRRGVYAGTASERGDGARGRDTAALRSESICGWWWPLR
jgi:hypothetical protein